MAAAASHGRRRFAMLDSKSRVDPPRHKRPRGDDVESSPIWDGH